MLEDAAGDARVFDECHDVHGATATWADQYVDGEAPFQQRRPVQAAGTRRIVRAGGVGAVYHGLVMLVMRRDRRIARRVDGFRGDPRAAQLVPLLDDEIGWLRANRAPSLPSGTIQREGRMKCTGALLPHHHLWSMVGR